MTTLDPTYRWATPDDLPTVALLYDMANEGLIADVWGKEAKEGETWVDVCCRYMMQEQSEISYKNTIVAEVDGKVVGALIFFPLADPMPKIDFAQIPAHMRSFFELKDMVPGSLFIRDIGVFPEYRGRRIATTMLNIAFNLGFQAGFKTGSVIVHETNVKQLAHYYKRGMKLVASRPALEHNFYPPESLWYLLKLDAPEESGQPDSNTQNT